MEMGHSLQFPQSGRLVIDWVHHNHNLSPIHIKHALWIASLWFAEMSAVCVLLQTITVGVSCFDLTFTGN